MANANFWADPDWEGSRDTLRPINLIRLASPRPLKPIADPKLFNTGVTHWSLFAYLLNS